MVNTSTSYNKRLKNRKKLCPTGKESYRDEIEANLKLATLKRLDKTYVRDGKYLSVKRSYKCNQCKYWHLTSRA